MEWKRKLARRRAGELDDLAPAQHRDAQRAARGDRAQTSTNVLVRISAAERDALHRENDVAAEHERLLVDHRGDGAAADPETLSRRPRSDALHEQTDARSGHVERARQIAA